MKSRLTYYPIIRREFENIEELANVINKSVSYCKLRLAGKECFTTNDKRLIANYIGRADQIGILFEDEPTVQEIQIRKAIELLTRTVGADAAIDMLKGG